jgi:lysylphosphatidylglycerol synthetase-like protein (DUF2156 family)
LKRHNGGIEFTINREIRFYPSKKETSLEKNMDEATLINTWNAQRKSIAHSQLVSVIIISAVVALVATGQFATTTDEVRLAALVAVGTTGLLSLISQFAIIREASMVVKDLAKAKSNTGKIIGASGAYLQLTAVVMVVFAIGLFVTLVQAIY